MGGKIVVNVPGLIVMTTKEHLAICVCCRYPQVRMFWSQKKGFVLTCEEEVQRLVRSTCVYFVSLIN